MIVIGLLGFLRRFLSLSPPIKSCFSEQISVVMAIPWVSTTVSFSLLRECVVSANKVFLIGLTIELTVSGKKNFRPRVVSIILSMGWCVFVSILGVPLPKVEWRYVFRQFIFILVMEGNRYRRSLKVTLGIAEDVENIDPMDCMVHLDLMEETHGGWHDMLSMEVMAEEGPHMAKFETGVLIRVPDFKEKEMIIIKNLGGKKLCVYVEDNYRVKISSSDLGTEILVLLCLQSGVTYTHRFKVAVYKNKAQPSEAACKSYQRKASMKLDF